MRTILLTLGLLALLASVQTSGKAQAPRACRPDTVGIVAAHAAMELSGIFDITVVATEGDSAGSSAAGQLVLMRNDSSRLTRPNIVGRVLPNRYYPAFGALTPSVLYMGIATEGAVTTLDPDRPGVLLSVHGNLEADTVVNLAISLGDKQNRVGAVIFDGAFTNVRVTNLGTDGFNGTWEASIGYTTWRAGGYFCAWRVN